jgi:Fe-S-cluster-containing dehydrogenase component
MARRIVIDLATCQQCDECVVDCRYHYRALSADHGIRGLRERATYHVVCRRCEEPSCIAACAFDALERDDDGVLERHNLRCVSCMMCAHACPFGTILPDMLPFYDTPCDYCLDPAGAAEPPCVASCRRGGLEYREVGPDEDSVHIVDEQLAARARKWEKREPQKGRGAG